MRRKKKNQKASRAIRCDAAWRDHAPGVPGFTKGGQRRGMVGERGSGEGLEGGGCSANLLSLRGGREREEEEEARDREQWRNVSNAILNHNQAHVERRAAGP